MNRTRRKLIEVALPLDAVNRVAAREKSIRHGHPSTLHLWWARRPLAAARAVIFAQMVDDPSAYVDVLLSDSRKKRAAQRALKARGTDPRDRQALAARGGRARTRASVRDSGEAGHLGKHDRRRRAAGGADGNLAELAASLRRTRAFADVDVPLASTFMLSTKKGREAYVEPVIEGRGYRFAVKVGAPPDAEAAKIGTKLSRGANFRCLVSGSPIAGDYIKAEGLAGRLGARLMAIVTEGDRGRVYLTPSDEHERAAKQALPGWQPEQSLPDDPRNFWVVLYGLTRYCDLFTPRQLVALTTFSDLVGEVTERVRRDAAAAGLPDDDRRLRDGGVSATAYAEAVAVYLVFALSKLADRGSTICTWFTERDSTRNTFARQSIPMTWDYAELNTLLTGTGSFLGAVDWTAESIDGVAAGHGSPLGAAVQADANNQILSVDRVVSTDPPYYDNIGYAKSFRTVPKEAGL